MDEIDESKKEGKDQESIQSSTTPEPEYQWETQLFSFWLQRGQNSPLNARSSLTTRACKTQRVALLETHNVVNVFNMPIPINIRVGTQMGLSTVLKNMELDGIDSLSLSSVLL